MKAIKRILVILPFLVGIYSNINAQDSQSRKHIKDSKLDKFVGTWQWSSGDSVLTVVLLKTQLDLKKENPKDIDDNIYDIIIGWHEFSIKGEVVESSLSAKKNYFDHVKKDYTILGQRISTETNDYRLRIVQFTDIRANDARSGSIIMTSNDLNTATMVLGGGLMSGMREKPIKLTVPGKLVLKRIK